MRNIILIILFLPIACNTKKTHEKFLLPDRTEIVKIVETIIPKRDVLAKYDSIALIYEPLVSELEKLNVYLPRIENEKEIAVLSSSNLDITKLLRLKINGELFFNQNDSTFLLYQNDIFKNIDLKNELESKYHLTTFEKQNTKRKIGEELYWTISVPVFSKDLKKVYMQIDKHCYGLCGFGFYLLLEKINNKWAVIGYKRTWVS